MSARSRWILVGVLILGAGLFLAGTRKPSAAVLYSGTSQVTLPDLQLEVQISPPVARPGDDLQLTARLQNHSFGRQTPEVTIQLPSGLTADVFALPRGATSNLADRTITWNPIVDAGNSVALSLDLHAGPADTLQPERAIELLLQSGGLEQKGTAVIWLGILPIIDAINARPVVAVGQPVQLVAELNGPGPIKERWTLSDGRTIEVTSPSVVFPTVGEHTINLEAVNPAGRASRTTTVRVVPDPVAGFSTDDDTPAAGQTITLFSESGGQPPLRLTWDLGDGTRLSGPGPVEHTYAVPGIYEVQLVVENDYGRSEARWQIEVGSPPIADIAAPDQVALGQPFEVSALDDGTVLRHEWDMGDGRTREGNTIRYRYRLPGDYYIVLTARNEYGTADAGRWIRVEPGVTTLYIPSLFQSVSSLASALSADTDGIEGGLDPAVVELNEQFVVEALSFPAGTTPEEQLFAYLNAVRQRFGLPSLDYSYELSLAAQGHAQDKTAFPSNPHVGSDGATAAERLLRSGYPGGYGGEATAWGFSDAREAVEFWMNSEAHRVILLNRNVTDLGVGFVEDYGSANVWHWTADFGNRYGSAIRPALRVQEPESGALSLNTDIMNFGWFWPSPLASNQQFLVYLYVDDQPLLVGSANRPVYGSRYVVSAPLENQTAAFWDGTGTFLNATWQVRLVDGVGSVQAESERRPIVVRQDPETAQPLPEPTLAVSPTVPSLVTATPSVVVTPTATPVPPTSTPEAIDQPPALITATPLP